MNQAVTTTGTAEARGLVSMALRSYAADIEASLERASNLSPQFRSDVQAEIKLLHAMASNVTGWTHTTRLRAFLDAYDAKTAQAVSA